MASEAVGRQRPVQSAILSRRSAEMLELLKIAPGAGYPKRKCVRISFVALLGLKA
jgi:hypothetical protein